MKYNAFGNTGIKISALGFGCMRFPMIEKDGNDVVDQESVNKMIHKAFEEGVNYYDTAYFYNNFLSEPALGIAIKPYRDKVYISSKSPGDRIKKKGDYRKLLEEQLRRLDMDYLDFYHFHGIGYDNFHEVDKRSAWMAEARQAKEEGIIRHISFSFHDKPENMIKLIDLGFFESVLCQYNIVDRSNEEAMAYAKSKGLGVIIMGPLGGGRASGLPREILEKEGIKTNSSAETGLRFVLSNPSVDCALSGMSTMAMVEENVNTASDGSVMSSLELQSVQNMMEENKRLSDLYCTGCAYCIPCPAGVNIPHIFQQMNYYSVYGLKEYSRERYAEIGKVPWAKGNRADACTDCGLCEDKCPQSLPIRDQLKASHAALG